MSTIFKKNRLFSGKNRSPDEFCKWLLLSEYCVYAGGTAPVLAFLLRGHKVANVNVRFAILNANAIIEGKSHF